MLRSEFIAQADAPVVILFGGSTHRREEVIELIKSIGGITVYGTLSFEEGMNAIKNSPNVNLVLIGGRYTHEQRTLIKQYVRDHLPLTAITEPGFEYPYSNELIKQDIRKKLGL